MKIYKLNSLTTLLFTFLILGLAAYVPIVLIEATWNTTIGKTYADLNINFWQALILWLIFLVLLNILGIFKFEFAIETRQNLDKGNLKKKIEELKHNLQAKGEEKPGLETNIPKDKKD